MSETPPGADDAPPRADLDETPPLLGSWRAIYVVVLVSQALVATAFYALTRSLAP